MFITSHVVISGACTIEDHTFFGVNCTVRDETVIARETLVGAGTIILKDTQPFEVYKAKGTEPDRLPQRRDPEFVAQDQGVVSAPGRVTRNGGVAGREEGSALSVVGRERRGGPAGAGYCLRGDAPLRRRGEVAS